MFPYQELSSALHLDIAKHCAPDDLDLVSDDSIEAVRCKMLNRSFFKKLAPNGQSGLADEAALTKFKALNSSISDQPFEYMVETEQDKVFIDYFADNFAKALTPSDVSFDCRFIGDHMSAGPGASLFCKNESFYTKLFDSRITATHPYLLALYRAAISDTDLWAEAEMQRHLKFGERIVSGNRLFFVPKDAVISRTCCTEPLVNMLIQQALGAFLSKCLERSYGVNLRTQPDYNRELARIGSIDGSFGTIDLQSASDSISWTMVQRFCPSNLLGYLRLARCERTILPDGTDMALNMISTMGNGFTFPLQTIIFASVVRSVYQMMGLRSSCPRTQFGVFGDDIIVRREAYNFVVRSLTKLGFKVNDSKSFNTGPFRESCGYDWFNGHFVRGVYIRSLETVTDVYSAINRLNRWSAVSGVRLPNTILCLKRQLRKIDLDRKIPFAEAIDGGIQVPFELTVPKVTDNYWFAYKKLAKRSRRLKVPDSPESSRMSGYSHFNEFGWGVTRLGGFARSADISITADVLGANRERLSDWTGYIQPRNLGRNSPIKVVRCAVPYWDWLGPRESVKLSYEQEAYTDGLWRFTSYTAWRASVADNG